MLVCYDPYVGTLGRFSRAEIIELVAKAGYDGINLPIREPFIDGKDESQIEDTEKLLAKHQLVAPSVGFGNHIVTTPTMRKETMEHFAIVLNIAKRFKAEIIGIWPNMPKDASVEAARKTLAANLSEMLPQTEEAGIAIALEFEKGCPLDNYREGIEFINSTDTRLRLTCDTYHLFNDKADPYQSVLAMGKLLGDVHISGSHRGEPGTDEFDFKAFMKGLREINYNGLLTLQYHLKDVESMARSCEFTKRLLYK